MIKFIRSIFNAIMLVSFTACSSLPISEDLQKSIFRGAKDQFFTHSPRNAVENWKELQDTTLKKYITKVGEKVRNQTQVSTLEYVVVNTPVVQAISSYDTSTIYLTLGMLNSIQNEAELACLLGHEIHHQVQFIQNPNDEKPHSFAQDVYENFSPDQLRGLGLRQDLEDISYSSHSKNKETDSDEQGSILCGKAGYQAYALSDLQKRITANIRNNPLDKLKNLKGTHDELKDRSNHLRKWLDQKGIKESQGNLGLSGYANSFQRLKSGALTPAQRLTLHNLSQIRKRVEQIESAGKTATAAVISKLTSQLSKIVQREKITYAELSQLSVNNVLGDHFMQERVVNPYDRYGNFHNQATSQVFSILEGIGRIALWFTPLGAVIDFHDLVTGYDFFTGEKLSTWERALSGVGLAVGRGRTLRELVIGLRETKAFILDDKIIRQGESLLEGIKASSSLNKIYASETFRRTDFYVRSNGEVIPAKGYRYIPSHAPYRNELLTNGKIPGGASNTYLSFEKYERSEIAQSKLQLRSENDAGFRIEFDTKQILKDIRIPRGKNGTADYLEPLTEDYPEFGIGRATQAVTNHSIQANKIVNLKSGEVAYELNK